jgi:hypothetical protein
MILTSSRRIRRAGTHPLTSAIFSALDLSQEAALGLQDPTLAADRAVRRRDGARRARPIRLALEHRARAAPAASLAAALTRPQDRFGFCFVAGVPATPEATEALCAQIGFLRETQCASLPLARTRAR